MLVEQYVEVETENKAQVKKPEIRKQSPYFSEIIRMLENWGVWARFYFDGAYPHENMIYKFSKQATSYDVIDEEIVLMNMIIGRYQNSKLKEEQDWFELINLKYKGVNYIENGSQVYDKLNEFMIAKKMGCSQKTVNNKFHKLIEDLEIKIYSTC